MARTVLVEHYEASGSVFRFRMTPEGWDEFSTMADSFVSGDGWAAFYLVWKTQKHKWNGCRRKTLVESLTPSGLAVDFKEVQSACCGSRVVPFLVPADEWISRLGE